MGCAGICHRDQSHSCWGALDDQVEGTGLGCAGICHSAHRSSRTHCLGREEVGEIQGNHGSSLRPSLLHNLRPCLRSLRPSFHRRSHLGTDRLRTYSPGLQLNDHCYQPEQSTSESEQ